MDFFLPNGRENVKMDQIGVTGIRRYALLTPVDSFYPRPLNEFLQGVEMGYFF